MHQRSESGRCLVVVGCQWGDEGKGKIVDVLAQQVDAVARYQGGANAGHTVHVADEEFVLHQIPSGILHAGKRCLLGNGVVLDLVQFFEEYDALEDRGVDLTDRVGVSSRAQLLLPYHRVLDQIAEDRAREKIGTTGRGIGPAYEDKVGRRGIRVADAADRDRLAELLREGAARAAQRLRIMGAEAEEALEADTLHCLELQERLCELATDVGREVDELLSSGGRILLEGAQGTALDLDHGTYPFVTSSNTTAAGAAIGVGVGPTRIDSVLGVMKAYTTRVGNGPFPTEFGAEMDERVRELGGEFGATTGRPRRCGWFDAVLARYARRVNGLTGIAITKLDVLDTLPEICIAVEYETPRGRTEDFPPDARNLEESRPVLETLAGWETSTSDARCVNDLPINARRYLDRIQELVGAPIEMVSVGTRRRQVIHVG